MDPILWLVMYPNKINLKNSLKEEKAQKYTQETWARASSSSPCSMHGYVDA